MLVFIPRVCCGSLEQTRLEWVVVAVRGEKSILSLALLVRPEPNLALYHRGLSRVDVSPIVCHLRLLTQKAMRPDVKFVGCVCVCVFG